MLGLSNLFRQIGSDNTAPKLANLIQFDQAIRKIPEHIRSVIQRTSLILIEFRQLGERIRSRRVANDCAKWLQGLRILLEKANLGVAEANVTLATTE